LKQLSTTALAKKLSIEPKRLFQELQNHGFIVRNIDKWELTEIGKKMGGVLLKTSDNIEYIGWPHNVDIQKYVAPQNTLNATRIGQKFNLSNQKTNQILTDLGWLTKDKGGKILTKEGIRNGGIQMTYATGIPYANWKETILENEFFKRAVEIANGNSTDIAQLTGLPIVDDFRIKYPPTKRAVDGHMVRSRAELLIDNFLYYNGIVHCYERKLDIVEPMFCDFYIPDRNVYIEYWGLEENSKYYERKLRK